MRGGRLLGLAVLVGRRVMGLSLVASVVAMALGSLVPASALAEPNEHPFSIVPGSFHFSTSSDVAGAHDDWVTAFEFGPQSGGPTDGDAREVVVRVPAGFDASDVAVPTCTEAQLLAQNAASITGELPNCPVASQLGDLALEYTVGGGVYRQETVPVYNMEATSFGVTAELGYKTATFTGLIQIRVRGEDLGLTATTIDIPPLGEVHKVVFTVWGVPAASEHDFMRGARCGNQNEIPPICRNEFGAPQKAGVPARALLSNPTSCESESEVRLWADSYEEPFGSGLSQWPQAGSVVPAYVECDRLLFEPGIEASPSTRSVESPTGIGVSLLVGQEWGNPLNNPTSPTSSYVKGATVALPEGMTANPGLAEGLGACTPAEYARETSSSAPGSGCPDESKIGTISIETPLLAEPIKGAVYIATPFDNPFPEPPAHPGGSLLALYVVAKDPVKGIVIKDAGKITPDPTTGRLVTTFERQPSIDGAPEQEGLPQQPFNWFTLQFSGTGVPPLISPPVCGSYSVQASVRPWSTPSEPRQIASQPFTISQGVGGGACPTGGVPPFRPEVISGTQNNAGGAYSPFYLRLLRGDGEQELVRFSTTLPPGLTGNLTGVEKCPDVDIQAAREATGAQELEHASCPAGSEIGHTLVGAGVGSVLAQNPGKIYLAGPYNGAPLSLVSITSAKVGPFDLGTVVIRFALDINPLTAQVEISGARSEAIPRILDGIVVHVRDIRVYIDRSSFIVNPTDCQSQSIADTVTGSSAAGQSTVSVSTPFTPANCASLKFEPKFSVSTQGKTSRVNGASLSVRLTYPNGPQGSQANIHQVKVELPQQLPSRLTTLQKACTRAQFDANPAGCPVASVVGHAKALTPILPVALEGPAYFVSNGNEAFPNLIVVLQGYGLTIDLIGDTHISKTGITSSTFRAVPDEPVAVFELTLPEGPNSALAANQNLCAPSQTVTKKVKVKVKRDHRTRTVTRRVKRPRPTIPTLTMPTEFVAQNGIVIHRTTPVVVTGCPKTLTRKNDKRKGKS